MAGLVLKLKPRERVWINGALFENGDRRSKISIISPDVNVLRCKYMITEECRDLSPAHTLHWQLQQQMAGLELDPEKRLRLGSKLLDYLPDQSENIKSGDWYLVLQALKEHRDFVNATAALT